ncbi:MAG: TraB/GumN family protein [Myxococcales bacterium]|nr:TraB/GumN family protein [Myxococcales bacterium]
MSGDSPTAAALHEAPGPATTSPIITPLSDTLTRIEDGDRTIWIVGTAHVSEASVNEVKALIAELAPETVCVELCEPRYKALTDESRWKKLDIFQVIKEGKTLFLMANIAMGAYQRRLGAELGVKPGAELLAAAQAAEAAGARVELVDRSIHVTLKRTWASLGFWKKSALIGAMIEALFPGKSDETVDIEKLKERAQLSEMMKEFAKALPEVHKPLIDERDQYLMSSIADSPGKRILAVVGAGHVQGMVGYYGKPVDRKALDVIPPPSPWLKVFEWGFIIAVLAAFVVGYFNQGAGSLEEMAKAWILPTALGCAAFTIVGLAHPLTVLVAALSAPLTTLNPLIVAGMPVGLSEAWLRRPTVADCEAINEDVQSLRGIYKNRFTRVLLVALLSTFGAAIGAWTGIGWVWSLAGQ